MSGLMNSYFYGKAGQGDYTTEQMPTTRKQLFFTTLKVRFSSMIGLNLMHFLFMLPLLIWLYVSMSAAMVYLEPADAVKLSGAPQQMIDAYNAYTAYGEERDAVLNGTQYAAARQAALLQIACRSFPSLEGQKKTAADAAGTPGQSDL